MTALQEVAVVLVVLYAGEMIRWVARAHRIMVEGRGRFFDERGPGLRLAGTVPGRLALKTARLRPFPAEGGWWFPQARDLAPGESMQADAWELVPAADLGAVEAEHCTVRGGTASWEAPSAAEAALVARRMRTTPGANDELTGPEELVRRLECGRALTRELRFWCRILAVIVLVLLPAAAWLPWLPWLWRPVLALALATWGVVAMVAVEGRRNLRRAGLPVPLASRWVAALLVPSSASRLEEILLESVAAGLDRPTVVAALLEPEDAAVVLEAEEALALHAAADGPAGWREHWRGVAVRLHEQLSSLRAGADRESAAVDGVRCPVCRAEFQAGVRACPDCVLPLGPKP